MAGKPLIQHTIEAALAAKRINEVYVSTEDSEIAGIAESLGALIIDRPIELAGEMVSTFDVMKHAEETLNSPDVLVVLQPTSPLRNAQEIDKAIALLEPDVDTVVGVCELKKYQWDRDIRGNYAQPAFTERLPRPRALVQASKRLLRGCRDPRTLAERLPRPAHACRDPC